MRAPDERQKIWNDPQRLEEWTNAALIASGVQDDDIPFENLPRATPAEWRQHLIHIAKVDARQGRPERLRKLLPGFAEFIHAPPRARGQRYTPQSDPFTAHALELALGDVGEIRQTLARVFWQGLRPSAWTNCTGNCCPAVWLDRRATADPPQESAPRAQVLNV